MNRRRLTLISLTLTACLLANAGGWIRINQLGYLPHATKVAVLISQEKVEVTQFELVDAYTGKTAYRATTIRNMGANGQMASTCRLDFSAFEGEGAYRIVAAGIESPVFPINNRVWDGTADFVLNYMRQRTGKSAKIKAKVLTDEQMVVAMERYQSYGQTESDGTHAGGYSVV